MTLPNDHPNVRIPGTEVRSLKSTVVDQEYRLFISFPPDYSSSGKSYPVLYLLDANVLFGMTTDVIRGLNLGQEIPDMIIVGIGYPVDFYPQTAPLRERDYIPTLSKDGARITGGAVNFIDFIQTELIPFIENNYRANKNDRTILGYSLGGLFAFYALFQQPGLFHRFVLISPAIGWEGRVTFSLEAQYAQKSKSLPARIFYSWGSLENDLFQTDLRNFAHSMHQRNYDGLEMKIHMFDDETHLSVPASAICRGLIEVFN